MNYTQFGKVLHSGEFIHHHLRLPLLSIEASSLNKAYLYRLFATPLWTFSLNEEICSERQTFDLLTGYNSRHEEHWHVVLSIQNFLFVVLIGTNQIPQ